MQLLCGGLQLRLPLLSLISTVLQFLLQGHYRGVHPLPLLFYLVLGLTGGHTQKSAQKLYNLYRLHAEKQSYAFIQQIRKLLPKK